MILTTNPEGVFLGASPAQRQATQLAGQDAITFLFREGATQDRMPQDLCDQILGFFTLAEFEFDEFLRSADANSLELADRLRARMTQYKFEEV